MLVADPLNVVLTKAVTQQSWAFAGFHRDNAGAVLLLQVVARGQGPGRPRGGNKGGQPQPGPYGAKRLEDTLQRRPSAGIMREVIAELGELVEDNVAGVARQLGAFIIDFLNVALRARSANDVLWPARPPPQPLEPLLAHTLGQDGDAAAIEDP